MYLNISGDSVGKFEEKEGFNEALRRPNFEGTRLGRKSEPGPAILQLMTMENFNCSGVPRTNAKGYSYE
jgi:hypothetical protein